MLRVLIAASALLLAAGVSAGCGGASIQKVADENSKVFLGDPHPTILRVEKVQIVNGAREAVVLMRGRFKVANECPPLAGSARHCPRFSHPRYAALDFSLPDPKDSQGWWIPLPWQVDAITAARAARPQFSIFPDFMNFTVRCGIPAGGPSPRTIAGTCSTYTDTSHHVRRVTFLERWPRASRPDGSWPHYEKSGGWIVTLGRSGRVQSIRVRGQPPQLRR